MPVRAETEHGQVVAARGPHCGGVARTAGLDIGSGLEPGDALVGDAEGPGEAAPHPGGEAARVVWAEIEVLVELERAHARAVELAPLAERCQLGVGGHRRVAGGDQNRRTGTLADRVGDQLRAGAREIGRVHGLDDQGIGHRTAEDTTTDQCACSW